MEQGIVKFFNETKGFGFISPEHGKDIFFHQINIDEKSKQITEGDKVKYTIETEKNNRIKAVNVMLS